MDIIQYWYGRTQYLVSKHLPINRINLFLHEHLPQRLFTGPEVKGRMFYNWSAVVNENLPCLQWYLDDQNKTGTDVKPETDYSCPCTEHHATRDTRLYMDTPLHMANQLPVNYTCYRYRFIKDNTTSEPVCCYDS